MRQSTGYNGHDMAKSLYIKSVANIYQVRDKEQNKLAQFQSYEETAAFLRKHDETRVDVWLLQKRNGELIDICEGEKFTEKYGWEVLQLFQSHNKPPKTTSTASDSRICKTGINNSTSHYRWSLK